MIDLFPPSDDVRLNPWSPNRGGKGTYVSTFEYFQGPDFEDNSLNCIVEKKSRYELDETNWEKVDFLELLMSNPHPNLLVPNNIIAIPGKKLVEYYDYHSDPTISDISFAIEDALKDGRIDVNELLSLFIQVADGLSFIHENGFVHQDVRRPNVLLVRTDEGVQAKLLDYGAVRRPYFLEDGSESWNVRPPEEREGSVWITAKQDVYMLGRLFRQTLSINTPQVSEEFVDIYHRATGPLDERQEHAGIIRDELAALLK